MLPLYAKYSAQRRGLKLEVLQAFTYLHVQLINSSGGELRQEYCQHTLCSMYLSACVNCLLVLDCVECLVPVLRQAVLVRM